MAKEALLKIVNAEHEADSLVKQAVDDAKNMVIKAESSSDIHIQKAIMKAKAECDRLKSEAKEEMQGELEEIASKSEKKCKSIVEIPQDRFDEAKKMLIERIVK